MAADPGSDVVVWDGGEGKVGAGEFFRSDRVFFWPGFSGGDAGGGDFDENGIGRNEVGVEAAWWGEVLVAGEEDFFGDDPAVKGEVVEGSVEGIGGGTAVSGADGEVVGIGDGWFFGGAAHVPGALLDADTIDEGDDGFWFSEGIAEGEMVPVSVVGEAFGGGPAVVIAFWSVAAEEKGGEGGALVAFEAEGPVLVFGGEGFVFVAAFSDEIGKPAIAEGVEADPGFDGEGVSVAEAEGGGVGELPRGGAVELEGGVFCGKAGVFGRDERALGKSGISDGVTGFVCFEVP